MKESTSSVQKQMLKLRYAFSYMSQYILEGTDAAYGTCINSLFSPGAGFEAGGVSVWF